MLVYGKGHKGFHYLFSKLTVREDCTPPFPRHTTTDIPLCQLKHQDKEDSSSGQEVLTDSAAEQRH